jgi:hypothetical protein
MCISQINLVLNTLLSTYRLKNEHDDLIIIINKERFRELVEYSLDKNINSDVYIDIE